MIRAGILHAGVLVTWRASQIWLERASSKLLLSHEHGIGECGPRKHDLQAIDFLQFFQGQRKSSTGWTNGADRSAPVRQQLKEIKVNHVSTSAFVSTVAVAVAVVVGIGATASGDAYAQTLLAQHSGAGHYGPFGEAPLAQPLLEHGGSAYFGPFGEPPLVIKDTAVTGGAPMPTLERVVGNIEIKTTFGEQPLVIKDTAVMGGAAMPTVEPLESNFPEYKPAK